MPELPEIYNRAIEMNRLLTGKHISSIEVLQPKCLNIAVDDFINALSGAILKGTTYHGKWLITETNRGWLLLNMGMGGEILLVTRQSLPGKFRLIIDFQDDTCLAINFWWFGYVHYAPPGQLQAHEMSARLGPNAIDLDVEHLHKLFKGQKGRLKAFLLDQSKLAGIGNAYIHDILFLAQLHPLQPMSSLTDEQIDRLAGAIHAGLQPSMDKGGAFYEVSLLGEKGGFQSEELIIGYRQGSPCPVCSTPIEKIKTGSNSSFICPTCQIIS
jgi:formamidopyrimidine-DNA glycosylase